MFHHEILSREDNETIKKIYTKQKEDKTRGDWVTLLEADFQFIGIDLKEEEICSITKSEYKEKIKSLIKLKNQQKLRSLQLIWQKKQLIHILNQ